MSCETGFFATGIADRISTKIIKFLEILRTSKVYCRILHLDYCKKIIDYFETIEIRFLYVLLFVALTFCKFAHTHYPETNLVDFSPFHPPLLCKCNLFSC